MTLQTMTRDQIATLLDQSSSDWYRSGRTHRAADCHPGRPHAARGMCARCYQRWHRGRGTS